MRVSRTVLREAGVEMLRPTLHQSLKFCCFHYPTVSDIITGTDSNRRWRGYDAGYRPKLAINATNEAGRCAKMPLFSAISGLTVGHSRQCPTIS